MQSLKEGPSPTISVTLPADLLEWLQERAHDARIPVARRVREILLAHKEAIDNKDRIEAENSDRTVGVVMTVDQWGILHAEEIVREDPNDPTDLRRTLTG